MKAYTSLFCVVLCSTSFLAQAQSTTPGPGPKEVPVARPEIQVIAHQGAHRGEDYPKVSHNPETAGLLVGHWQMIKLTDPEGTILEQQKAEQRDRFRFQQDHAITVVKKGAVAEGYWKFSPESGHLIITDANKTQQVLYTVLNVSAEELVLLYQDELKGNKVLHFAPVP